MKLKILGPPGTGKTTKLMELLEKELQQGTSPNKIAFLTFTRAAREEALSRTGKTESDFPFLRTIHSICYRQMMTSQDQLVKPIHLRNFGKTLGLKLNGVNLDPWIEEFSRPHMAPTRDDLLLQVNHCGRHRGILLKESLDQSELDIDYKYAVWFTKAYRAWKKSEGLVDYTDLLTFYLDHGRPLDIEVMFVDEAQDLSCLQWEVVEKLGAKAIRHYIAGDDDQAIFHWAGADSKAFQDLAVDDTIVLDQSYRLSKNVHDLAMSISARIQNRLKKQYSSTAAEGLVRRIGYFSPEDFNEKTFVLFRHHYRGAEISQKLKDEGIPFIGWGSPLYDPNVRAALSAWYKLFKKGEVSSIQAKKMIKFCDKNVNDFQFNLESVLKAKKTVTVKDLFIRAPSWQDWESVMSNLPGKNVLRAFIKTSGFKKTANPITEVMSIHQSKGRESHTVILDTEISRQTYQSMLTNPDDEHRCWYVGVSRASERVLSLMCEGSYSYEIG